MAINVVNIIRMILLLSPWFKHKLLKQVKDFNIHIKTRTISKKLKKKTSQKCFKKEKSIKQLCTVSLIDDSI